ncbi:hypothetical protein [Candidatus Thiodiazotropha sp. LNASS1]|uniref:hypothetical protein n=1 Tax=Candidatus Thiodiazotropha sp. LNASS1 TaxID=3096260 RepID=UPI0034DF509A
MARYKDYNYDQMKMLPVSYEKQILAGSFEYSLSYLIDNELDLKALINAITMTPMADQPMIRGCF